MKRSLSFSGGRELVLVIACTCLIAGTYGLVRLAYGLFLPDILASLQMTSATAGMTSSGASIAYCVGALLGLGASRHARLLVAGAVVTAAAGSVGMALSVDVQTFVPFAVLSSMGAGLASPGLVAIVERNVAVSGVSRAQAVVNAGTGPGLVTAGVMALVLLPDWRLGFTISAVFTAGAGLVVLLGERPPRDRIASIRRSSTATATAPPRANVAANHHADSGQLLRSRVLLRPAAAALLLGAASAAVWTYGRTQLISGGLGETASTMAWIVLGAGGSSAVLTAGPLAKLHPARAWQLTVSAVSFSIALLALVPGHVVWAMAAFAVFGWGFVAATSALIGWAAVFLPGRAASGTSVLFVTLVLGQAAGAALTALLAGTHGLSGGFGLAAALGVLAVICGLAKPSSNRGQGSKMAVLDSRPIER